MSAWDTSPATLTLTANDLHLWQVALEQPEPMVQRQRELLSADELARADRFHFDRDRRRFIVARSVLRSVLSRYVQQTPEQIIFSYTPHGKPVIAAPLHFNVAHSHELALFAVTRLAPVGIDVEYMVRPVDDRNELADRFFSAEEVAVYRSLPDSEKQAAFWRCWTRKEAYIKAIGVGLSYPLDRFAVSLAPGAPAALLRSDDYPQAAQRWSVLHLAPAHDYVGAVAIEARSCQVSSWTWNDTG
jgi:4'-phosphopantetheinyl transferase